MRSYKRRDCCALARILRAERINVCKYIPFFLISTLSVGQYRFEIVFSIDGAFLSATSVLPTMSTKNTTKVYQKGHKSPFFSLKKANWKLWSCTFGRGVGNTGFEIGKRQRHILPTAKRIWLTHCCQIGRLSFLLPFFRSLISSLFFEILWLMLYGIFFIDKNHQRYTALTFGHSYIRRILDRFESGLAINGIQFSIRCSPYSEIEMLLQGFRFYFFAEFMTFYMIICWIVRIYFW